MLRGSENLNFGHTHMKMSWVRYEISRRDGDLAYPPPLSTPSSPSHSSHSKISPAVLFIIVILAVLFFISGLLHLLIRFLMKHPSPSSQSNDRYPEVSPSDALQRQLQQLFHLHDSGLDQAFIDALPVFMYKEIGDFAEEPFDCAVCLCEFTEKDQLRLLPMCSHAFHINCIDTWLLTNSTCPLCRGSLFTPGMSIENPIYDFDDFRDDDLDNGENLFVHRQKTIAIDENGKGKGLLPVRLGKFRKLSNGDEVADVGETSSSNLDARRCYSMGSYQYVVGNSNIKVALTGDRNSRDIQLKRGQVHTIPLSIFHTSSIPLFHTLSHFFFMGAAFSYLESGSNQTWSGPGLGDMPESCVALVLAYLDPSEICKLSRLNRVFRQASWADCVWESKLPQDYKILVTRHFSEISRLPKKDIYARLCESIKFDGGTKEVWMDKSSGEICVGVSWRGMKITRIDDRRHWTIIQTDESRLGTMAYLQQTWWLEVDGNLELNFPKGTYSLYFRLRLGKCDKRTSNLDRIHGWDIKPVRFQFCTGDGQHSTSQAYLGEPRRWVNYHVGDFVVENTHILTKIKFSMMQIDCTHTKGGLCLDSVLILPKKV